MGIAEDIIIILVFGLVSGLVTGKLRLPLFLGYIITGIVIGPHTGGITVSDAHGIEVLAEIGVALLLFSIGLELSFSELKEVKMIALVGTPLQVIITIAFGTGTGLLMGFGFSDSLFLGMVMSLSSTMIVLKVLMNRGLTGTLSSRVMIGILIVQDLAAIPLLVLIPQINNLPGNVPAMLMALVKSFAFLAIIIILGVRIIPVILRKVSALNSPELFLLTVTCLGLGVGYIAYLSNLSFAIGAFVAGMVLSDSDYSHQAMSNIIPLRDIFGLLFFVSIGMLFEPGYFISHTGTILAIAAATIAGKALIFFVLTRAFGYYNIIPLAAGLGLAQIGEFSFVISTLGLKKNIISHDFYSILLSVTIITMFVSPFLSMLVTPVYGFIRRRSGSEPVQTVNFTRDEINGHVIIAGGGRVGLSSGDALDGLGIPFIIIENDFRRFERVRDRKYPVIFGDSSGHTVLEAAGITGAKLLMLTVPSIIPSREIVRAVREIRHDIPIIARTESMEQMEEMLKLDIHDPVQPEFEASLELIRQALVYYGKPVTEIENFVENIRFEKYSGIYSTYRDTRGRGVMSNLSRFIQFFWMEIPRGAYAAGKSIRELGIRSKTGTSVAGILRGESFYPNPDPDFVFSAGDVIAVIGNPDSRSNTESLLNNSSREYDDEKNS